MGSVCTYDSRRDDDKAALPHNESVPATKNHTKIVEYLENRERARDDHRTRISLQKADKLCQIMNSSCNYWINENASLFDGSHRTTVTYQLEIKTDELVRTENILVTEKVRNLVPENS